MKAFFHSILTAALLFAVPAAVADELPDSVRQRPVYPIEEVVVTGTRNETDVRLLPMTVSVVDRAAIERSGRQSLLPILTEQVPGLFATARGIMGYGVSTGAAGGMSLRGIGGAPQAGLPTTGLLVLIDGHPQYMGLMGHPIADAYQSMLAERVEVVRGPASVLYGSNAMGGVINIVTRKQREEGIRTDLQAAYGSYNTLQTELSNRIRKGRFTSVVTGSYNRTDGHRADMGFEQYGGYAKLGYELSRAWTLSGDVNLTHFNASNPGEVTAPLIDNDSRITRGRASAALANRYDRTSGALSLFYNWGRHKIDDGYAAGSEPLDYRFNSRDRMLGVSWYQSAQLFAGNRLTVGFDYFHFGGESWNRFLDGHEEPQVDKTQDEVAGYVDFRQSLGTWLTLDAGLRVDRHSHVGTEWVPQAGVSFHLPRDQALGRQRIPLPHHPRTLHVPPREPRPASRAAVELRTVALAAAMGGTALLRRQSLLYRRRKPDPAYARRRAADERQHRPDRECGRRSRNRIPHLGGMERRRQLQFPAHGTSRAGRSRTQTPRRSLLHAGPLVGLDGPAIRGGSLHFDRRRRDGQRRTGKFHPVEPARRFPDLAQIAYLRRRREPAGAAL